MKKLHDCLEKELGYFFHESEFMGEFEIDEADRAYLSIFKVTNERGLHVGGALAFCGFRGMTRNGSGVLAVSVDGEDAEVLEVIHERSHCCKFTLQWESYRPNRSSVASYVVECESVQFIEAGFERKSPVVLL